jgi:hypothetical protein
MLTPVRRPLQPVHVAVQSIGQKILQTTPRFIAKIGNAGHPRHLKASRLAFTLDELLQGSRRHDL